MHFSTIWPIPVLGISIFMYWNVIDGDQVFKNLLKIVKSVFIWHNIYRAV